LRCEYINELLGTIALSHLQEIDHYLRKQQGIYYTPSYIVNFILENTLGQKFTQKWKKLEQLFNEEKYDELVKFLKRNSKISVIDPACGSGIFLIEAKRLLRKYYEKITGKLKITGKTETHVKSICSILEDLLSSRIIDENLVSENIYGCELDSTAIRSTIMTLMPKSNDASAQTFVNENIVLGDFLISGYEEYDDISIFQSEIENVKKIRRSIKESPINETKRELQVQEKKLKKQINSNINKPLEQFFPIEWKKIVPFNCEIEFPEVMCESGFDVVIGNPPYFTIEGRRSNERTIYYKYLKESQKWKPFFRSNSDISYYFIIQSVRILKNKGCLGFIVSQYFLDNDFADKLRQYILDHAVIEKIIHFGNLKLFPDADTDTCILILRKEEDKAVREQHQIKIVRCKKQPYNESVRENKLSRKEKLHQQNKALLKHIQRHILNDTHSDELIDVFWVQQNSLSASKWVLSIHKEIIEKIESVNSTLADSCHIGEGFKTGLNEAFIVDEDTIIKFSLEREILVPLLRNSDISRYYTNHKGLYLIYTTNKTKIDSYKNVKKYLEGFRERLENRFQFKDGTCKWYSLSIPQSQELFDNSAEKVICPYRAGRNTFAYDNEMHYGLTDTYIVVPKEKCEMHIYYLLALLNSQVLGFWYKQAGKAKGGMNEYFTTPLRRIPIRKIDFSNSEDVSIHDTLVELVAQLISLVDAKLTASKIEQDIVELQVRIDRLVYKLYNTLSEDDIKIVEDETR